MVVITQRLTGLPRRNVTSPTVTVCQSSSRERLRAVDDEVGPEPLDGQRPGRLLTADRAHPRRSSRSAAPARRCCRDGDGEGVGEGRVVAGLVSSRAAACASWGRRTTRDARRRDRGPARSQSSARRPRLDPGQVEGEQPDRHRPRPSGAGTCRSSVSRGAQPQPARPDSRVGGPGVGQHVEQLACPSRAETRTPSRVDDHPGPVVGEPVRQHGRAAQLVACSWPLDLRGWTWTRVSRTPQSPLPPPNMILSQLGTQARPRRFEVRFATGSPGAAPPAPSVARQGGRARRPRLHSGGVLGSPSTSVSPPRPRPGPARSSDGAAPRRRPSRSCPRPGGLPGGTALRPRWRAAARSSATRARRWRSSAAGAAVTDQPVSVLVLDGDEVAAGVVGERRRAGAPGDGVLHRSASSGRPRAARRPTRRCWGRRSAPGAGRPRPRRGSAPPTRPERRRTDESWARWATWARSAITGAANAMIFSTEVPAAWATASGVSPARMRVWMSRGRRR